MYRNQGEKIREDPSTLTYIIFTCKQSWCPQKIVFKLEFIVFNDGLGHTVSTKLTINQSEFMRLRYQQKRAEI
jgi:hypothetical protein